MEFVFKGKKKRAEFELGAPVRLRNTIYLLLSVSAAVLVRPLRVAEIVTTSFLVTGEVVIVKLALLLPAATVTDGGTAALLELLDKLMIKPPVGAGAVRVTVPDELSPPRTEVGFKARLDSVAAG